MNSRLWSFAESPLRLLVLIAVVCTTTCRASAAADAPSALDLSFDPGSSIDGPIYSMARQSDGKIVIVGQFTTVNGAVRGGIARLNADGTPDTTFGDGLAGVGFSISEPVLGVKPSVRSVALQPDGKILIGGTFSAINGMVRSRIARLNADGTLDTSFPNGPLEIQSIVSSFFPFRGIRSVALQSDGKILIGGSFYAVNGVARSSIARLNPDGTLDLAFGNNLSASGGTVSSVAVQPDGKILIGGDDEFARLTPDGTPDSSFATGLSGARSVRALTVQPDGKILIGGQFSTVNGAARKGIARLNADGTLDTAFGNGLSGAHRGVESMALQIDGKILIGGSFATVNDVERNRIARLNTDGTLDTAFATGLSGVNSSVLSLSVRSDGKILIGGWFTSVNGVGRSSIEQVNPDGTLDTGFGSGRTGADAFIRSVAVQPDGKVLIGGDFTTIGGKAHGRIARLNPDGTLDTTFGNGLAGADIYVTSMAVQPDGRILIGGRFSTVNGVARDRIARLNADGSLDAAFATGVGAPSGSVTSVVVQPDGKILIGGEFRAVNGVTRNFVARLNADGSLDTAFASGVAGANDVVRIVAIQPDGKILIGGSFVTVHGVVGRKIARLNADGTLDTTFASGLPTTYGYVTSMAVQPDGKILIGGQFSTVHGAVRNGIARLNPDGSVDTTFIAGVAGTDAVVSSVALQRDGKILIGGAFSSVNGTARNDIARLNADGTLDTAFGDGQSGTNNVVSVVAVQLDGRILIGGGFTAVNGVGRDRVARLVGTVNVPRMINLSTRAFAGGGEATLIVGFVISGSGSKTVIIRGVGPKLASFGVTGVVADPALVLYSGQTPIGQNDNWDPSLAADFTTVGAFALDPGSKDAAMKVTLNPGAYTIHLVNTGPLAEALVEVYDFSKDAGTRLVNLSSRLSIAAGETAIVGTILDAPGAVVVRNVGPELRTYGVLGFHSDPVLRVFSGQTVIATNDDWDALLAPHFQSVGAFPLTSGSKDAASRVLLNPGAYTVHATGNGAPGIVLVELYESP